MRRHLEWVLILAILALGPLVFGYRSLHPRPAESSPPATTGATTAKPTVAASPQVSPAGPDSIGPHELRCLLCNGFRLKHVTNDKRLS